MSWHIVTYGHKKQKQHYFEQSRFGDAKYRSSLCGLHQFVSPDLLGKSETHRHCKVCEAMAEGWD